MPGQAAPHTDERALLLGYIKQQRDGLRYAAYGLTDEQARLAPSVSSLTVGGLIKHVALTERNWIGMVLQRPQNGESFEEQMASYQQGFMLGPDETLQSVLALMDEVEAETEEVVNSISDLNQPVPIPKGVPWFPQDVESWTVRWVLLHIVEEAARHAGHADIVRESIDKATMYELMAGAEGWPETPWIKPWKPAE
jgi:hypothetical protein